jgi:ribose-phosphate pyrophosphokinase
MVVLSGTANPGLATSIARELRVELGACRVERFPDGEVSVALTQPVRKQEVFILQSTSPPVDENLVELLAMADAVRRAAASHVTAVIPYLGYARQDKRHGRRESITASVVAELLEAVGVHHVLAVDLHAPQIEGFFRIPVDSLSGVPVLYQALRDRLRPGTAVVSPDAGRVPMATQYAARLGAPVIILHKRRESGTQTDVTHVVGDVRGRPCLIVDDIISTGGTIAESVQALLGAGAEPEMTVAATHGLLLEGAREKLEVAPIREIWITDTVPTAGRGWARLRVVSVAPLIAAALQRFLANGSISELVRTGGGMD